MSIAAIRRAQTAPKTEAQLARARRALRASGRRLMQLADGRWAVMVGGDRRRRAIVTLGPDDGRALVAQGEVAPAEGGGYVLAGDAGTRSKATCAAPAQPAGAAIFSAAGMWRARRTGKGFAGLARHAGEPGAALSLRQARAGLRLIADAERSAQATRVTMDWSATPAARGRRGGGASELDASARAATRRIAQLKSACGAAFALCWMACVEGRALSAVERLCRLPKHSGAERLANALERIAAAYDGMGEGADVRNSKKFLHRVPGESRDPDH